MTALKFPVYDGYDDYLKSALGSWSADQRTAVAAATAQVWLPLYTAFSEAEDWGDAAAIRAALDAVWSHLAAGGEGPDALTPAFIAEHKRRVTAATPHLDDFDCLAAIAASAMVGEALACCGGANLGHALQALNSGFYGVCDEWDMDEDEQPRLWRSAAVRAELARQLRIVELVAALPPLNSAVVADLQRNLAGVVVELPKATSQAPVGLTNEVLHQQYRGPVSSDLRNSDEWWLKLYEPGSMTRTTMILAAWAQRYGRRRAAIDGSSGGVADMTGLRAVQARTRTHDVAVTTIPDWDSAVVERLGMMLNNPAMQLDVHSLADTPMWGPSLRALWAEALAQGKTGDAAWLHILAWARHRPESWGPTGLFKKKAPRPAADFAKRAARPLTWNATGDVEIPWATEADGVRWQVRINDFPDEPMYGLLKDGALVGDFHDWPAAWER